MITYDNICYYKDGLPWCPVMGEFQYSRTDWRYWKEGLAKMKATGINTVASYVFWLHHEEIKGKFNFRGNCNLRKFVREIKESGMLMCLRIGPWVHAEARNGGFPDWLYEEPCKRRSNDSLYMQYVERLFRELYKQCEGYMYKDGGPIFAIQVENEYAQWGKQSDDFGDVHINALIELLKKIGFDVPVYMATGWGQSAVGNAVSVWGAYAEAPWEMEYGELTPRFGYLISPNPNDCDIGSDTGKKKMDADISEITGPYSTVELGAGIQVTKARRPVISGADNGAITLCRLASGASGLGYYVYHGGMNPVGILTSLQEYRKDYQEGEELDPGFCCDLPELNYDFQGAISQYVRIKESGLELKLWNYFVQEFPIVDMFVEYPEDNATQENDLQSLRYSVRERDGVGYLFFNNYVRHYDLPERNFKNFEVQASGEKIVFPQIRIKNKEYVAYPFNMKLGNALLKYATATPFCVLNGKDYVFWTTDGNADYCIEGNMDGKIITLTKSDALRAYKFHIDGQERLFIADGELYESEAGLRYVFSDNPKIKVYPPLKKTPEEFMRSGEENDFAVYTKSFQSEPIEARIISQKKTAEYTDYVVDIDYKLCASENVFLYVDYEGDRLDLCIDGEKVNDHFYMGVDFEIGLRHYNYPKQVCLRVYPLDEKTDIYVEKVPTYRNGKALNLLGVKIERLHCITLKL